LTFIEGVIMFGFFKKNKLVDSTEVIFNLKPLYNTLTSSQKSHFNAFADLMHADIHQRATTVGFKHLLLCAVGQRKNHEPQLITSELTQMYNFDPEFAAYDLLSFYPISKFDSVAACKNRVDEKSPQNSILSAISGEAAIRVLRGDLYLHKKSEDIALPLTSEVISQLSEKQQEDILNFSNQLVRDYGAIKSRLQSVDGKSIDPFFIKNACFVIFESQKQETYFLIDPNKQLPILEEKFNQKCSALVLIRELKAYKEYLRNSENRSLFAGLISEATLQLLSGTDSRDLID